MAQSERKRKTNCMRQAECTSLPGKQIALLIVTGLMLAFIFGQSVFPKSISAEESSRLTDNVLNPLLDLLGFEPVENHTVRKIAHVTEFAILSVLLTLCCRGRFVKSLSIGFTAAFLDESIQLLSGRGALISDVWIDLIGIAIGTLIGLLAYRMIRCRKNTRKNNADTQTDA